MNNQIETAKLKLVSIIAPDHLSESLASELRTLGATGFTTGRVEGWGAHGTSRFGVIQSGNIRVDSLVGDEIARKLLARLALVYSNQPVIAFMHDVEAIPRAHFE